MARLHFLNLRSSQKSVDKIVLVSYSAIGIFTVLLIPVFRYSTSLGLFEFGFASSQDAVTVTSPDLCVVKTPNLSIVAIVGSLVSQITLFRVAFAG